MSATTAELRERLEQAIGRRDALVPADSGDPATARLGGAALRQHHRATDSRLAGYAAAQQHVQAIEGQLARAEFRERDAARPKLTGADLVGATHVKDRHGWHEVVRVSAKSVTVRTAHSWTERIPLTQIIDAAHGRAR